MKTKIQDSINFVDGGYNANPLAEYQTVTNNGGIWNSLFSNAGNMFNGIASIVGAANTKTENVNKNIVQETKFSWTNGTTITAIVLGGVALIIAMILILRNK